MNTLLANNTNVEKPTSGRIYILNGSTVGSNDSFVVYTATLTYSNNVDESYHMQDLQTKYAYVYGTQQLNRVEQYISAVSNFADSYTCSDFEESGLVAQISQGVYVSYVQSINSALTGVSSSIKPYDDGIIGFKCVNNKPSLVVIEQVFFVFENNGLMIEEITNDTTNDPFYFVQRVYPNAFDE